MYKKIVENLIKSHAVNKALGQKSGQKPSTSQQAEIDSLDPFCLPPIPQNTGWVFGMFYHVPASDVYAMLILWCYQAFIFQMIASIMDDNKLIKQ